MRFYRFREISKGGGSTRQPQRTEPCQCVSGQPWACHGALTTRSNAASAVIRRCGGACTGCCGTGRTATPTNHLLSLAPVPSAAASTRPSKHFRGCIWPWGAPRHAYGWPLTHWQGSVCCGCRVLPPPLEISTNHRQNRQHQTTCPVLPQPPVQSPPYLLHTAEAAFDLAVPQGIPKAGHSHTLRALCAMVAKCFLLLWKSPQTRKPTTPTYHHLPSPAAAPSVASITPFEHCRG